MFQRVKGTRDFFSRDIKKYEWFFDILKNVVEKYNYKRIETPIFEYLELLEKKSGEEIKKQIYWFEDKAGRKLGLRFDMTLPCVRFILSNPYLPKPIRLYYFSRVWRYEEPQKRRYREFFQFGVELFGSKSILADFEVISICIEGLLELGLDKFRVQINDRILIENLLKNIGIKENFDEIFRTIDKLDKIGEKGVKEELMKIGIEEEKINEILKIIKEKNLDNFLNLGNKEIEERVNVIQELIDLLSEVGYKRYITFDPSIVRGLDYYTSIVFEVREEKEGRLTGSSLAGGGRYDNLVRIVSDGKIDLPATGFAYGVDRILEVLEENNKLPKFERELDFLVIPLKDVECKKVAIKIAKKLREKGYTVELEVMERSLRKALEYADKIKAKYVIIIGRQEVDKNVIKVKDLRKWKEYEVKIDELDKWLHELP